MRRYRYDRASRRSIFPQALVSAGAGKRLFEVVLPLADYSSILQR
jgi:hypothetical protein